MSWKLLLCLVGTLCCACHGAILPNPHSKTEPFELSILHINDFHARFLQTSSGTDVCTEGVTSKCVGGLPRLLAASRKLLEGRSNAIFLDAGDHFTGTFWQNLYSWNATATFFTRLPLDVSTFGSHDFDFTISELIPFVKSAKQPFLAANIDSSQEPTFKNYYKPSLILRRRSQKIGIIGVVSHETQTRSIPGKLKFSNELEAVKKEAAKLKAQGAKIIIVLSHCGLDVDKTIAAEAPHVDVIVGGRSHSFLYTGSQPDESDIREGTYPVVVKQTNNRTVLVVQAQAFTKYLGNLTVRFDRLGEVASWEGNPILLDNSVAPDPELLEEMKPWEEHALMVVRSKVGEAKVNLSNTQSRSNESNLANFVSDAMVFSQQGKAENPKHWTHAAIGVINAGALKSSIPAGEITYDKVLDAMPFANTWDVFELRGDDLLMALEESVSRSLQNDRFYSTSFLHWSGIKVKYDLSKPKFHRVVDLQVRCQECEEPIFEDLKKNKLYRIVSTSFVLRSGDATVILKKQRNRRPGKRDVDLLTDYIKKMSVIEGNLDQRVILDGTYRA